MVSKSSETERSSDYILKGSDALSNEIKDPKGSIKDIWKFTTTNDIWLLSFGCVMQFCSGALMPVFMLVFGDLIGDFGQLGGEQLYYIKLMAGVAGISFVLNFCGTWAMETFAETVTANIRHEYFRAILAQEMGYFDISDRMTLSPKLIENVTLIRNGIGSKMGQALMFGAIFVGGYIVGFIRGWLMTLVVSAALPVLAIAGFLMMKGLAGMSKMGVKAYSKAGAVAQETLDGIRMIAAYGGEDEALKTYGKLLDETFIIGLKSNMIFASGFGFLMFVLFLSYALGFWYGAVLVIRDIENNCEVNCFDGGNALTVFFAVLMAAFSLGQAGPPVSGVMKAISALASINEVIDRESSIDSYSESGKQGTMEGEIEFQNVKFTYPSRPEVPVLGGLNLKIPGGKTVALVGASGCGKSSIIQLICRFYDVDDGSIFVDKSDVRDYNVKWLRSNIAMVAQEPQLFTCSIEQNIRNGLLTADRKSVINASKQANAHIFIDEFPQRYETVVDHSGTQLSGGQKQRVAIARAMLRHPKVLILDEATSALDNESEKIVQRALDELIKESKNERTTIVIAHRLSTVRNADKIVVLDNDGGGAIAKEEGTHTELMALEDGIYRNLVNLQQLNAPDILSQLNDNESVSELVRRISSKLKDVPSAFDLKKRTMSTVDEEPGLTTTQRRMCGLLPAKVAKEPSETSISTMKPVSRWRVTKLLAPDWWKLLIGSVAAILNGLVFPFTAIIMAEIIGTYFKEDTNDIRVESAFWALMFVVLAVVSLLAVMLQSFFFDLAGQRLTKILRSNFFGAVVHQDMSFFDEPENDTGNLSEVLSSDCVLVRSWVGDNVGLAVQNLAGVIGGVVIAFTANVQLAAVTLSAFLVMAPAGYMQMKFLQNSASMATGTESASFTMHETLQGIRTVTAFSLQTEMEKKHKTALNAEMKAGKRNALFFAFFWGLSQFVSFAAQALSFWYGGKLLEEGRIPSVTELFRASFALMMAAMSVGQTAPFAVDAKKAAFGAARIYNVIDRKPQIDVRTKEGAILEHLDGNIRIEKVNFRYPSRPEVPIFDKVSFDVSAGQTVALVGTSGCGKSTIVQLLERFYDCENKNDEGGLFLESTNLKDLNIKFLRKQIGLVSQEPKLFSRSIEENIMLGKEGATKDEVIKAAKNANAHDFIMEFPDGYDTVCGLGGSQLSGGQKQRIAIAMALIRNPKILLLDEATSALDAESEKVVQDALDEVVISGKRTTIVIAHRLSTIKKCDKIMVFNKDKVDTGSYIAEIGTHDSLVNIPNGIYRNLVKIGNQ